MNIEHKDEKSRYKKEYLKTESDFEHRTKRKKISANISLAVPVQRYIFGIIVSSREEIQ
jgi:hypothetical protein